MSPAMRRYLFKLYPNPEQAERLDDQRKMIADLWNALLQRYEDIQRRTVQRQVWYDAEGGRHVGLTVHCPSWQAERYRHGELCTIGPDANGRPKPFTAYDMQNEVTYLCNECPEWRALSVWCGHRTAGLLDRAIKAFYRRAKEGAGAASGYPRHKRRDRHAGIPHRCLSGCRLTKDQRHRASWRLRLKGVPGDIHARGEFPGPSKRAPPLVPPSGSYTDADLLWRDNQWWLSICVAMPSRREPGRAPLKIRFNLVDCFALINGVAEDPPDFDRLPQLQDDLDQLKSERDQRWPRGKARNTEDEAAFVEANAEIAQWSAYMARLRRNALHVWTARIVARASDLTIHAPASIKSETRTPRGSAENWGANVSTGSAVNRHVLAQAPAAAIAMLQYKAEEAGIRCDVITDIDPEIRAGRDLVEAGKELRRVRRELKRKAA